MTLRVEDGTGLTDAESYVSVDGFKAYADGRGLEYVDDDDDKIEQALRRATAYIDTFRDQFSGFRTNRRAQALEWPRTGAYYAHADDQFVDYIEPDVVPPEIVQATCEAAVREAQSPGSMQPDMERGGAIQSLKAGSVEVVYAANASARTTTQIIDSILASLLVGGERAPGLFGNAVRG